MKMQPFVAERIGNSIHIGRRIILMSYELYDNSKVRVVRQLKSLRYEKPLLTQRLQKVIMTRWASVEMVAYSMRWPCIVNNQPEPPEVYGRFSSCREADVIFGNFRTFG